MFRMLTPEQYALLLKMTLRHENHIDALFGVVNDFACIIEHSLERCGRNHCKRAATVEQVDFGIKMCDLCAATAMVRARDNIKRNLTDSLAMQSLRVAIMSEDSWRDLPNAERIRRLSDYVGIINKNAETAPTDPEELH